MKEPRQTLITRRKPKAQKPGSTSSVSILVGYADLLTEVKSRLYVAQNHAVLSANTSISGKKTENQVCSEEKP